MATSCQGHFLLVLPGHSADDPNWEMRHPPDCPQTMHNRFFDGGFGYHCNVQFCLDHVGIDDLEGDVAPDNLEPGVYPVAFYSDWSGSMFEDSEAYLYLDEAPLTAAMAWENLKIQVQRAFLPLLERIQSFSQRMGYGRG